MLVNEVVVSVIIPFYKELDLIERAIDSVAIQRLPSGVSDVEVVIGNDSKLAEHQIRAVLSERSNRITRIAKNDQENGAGNARNAALDASRGDLIAFLDADDYWLPGKLEIQIGLIKDGANFVTGAYRLEGRETGVFPPEHIRSTVDFFKQLRVNTSTVLVHRDLLGMSRFKNLRVCQDAEFWARLAGKPGFRFASTRELVAIYAPSGRTGNKFKQLRAFSSVVRRFPLNVFQRSEIYLRYAARGLFNYYIRR